jgi:hypothetical protein
MFALNQMMAISNGMPDVCIIPIGPVPTPTPFPNVAMECMGMPFVKNILMGGAPVHNMATKILMSIGGTGPGVASGASFGPSSVMSGCATTVLMGGMPAKKMGAMGMSNSTNCPNFSTMPNQLKVLILAA